MQAEVRAARAHALGTLVAQFAQRGLLPIVLLAAHVHQGLLARQSAFDEDHLAFAVAGHALGFDVE
jgi:hypothetical protein